MRIADVHVGEAWSGAIVGKIASAVIRTPTALIALLAGIGILTPSVSQGNDTAAELSIGGLQFTKTSAIVMSREDLTISLDRVTVRYRFANVSADPVSLTVAFPLPAIDLSEGDNIAFPSDDPLNFVDFQSKVDGSPVKFTIDQRATVGEKDVTSLLKDNKLPVLPIGNQQIRVGDLPDTVRSKLIDAGLLMPAGSDERGKPRYEPGWVVKTSVVRQQTFLTGREVSVDHSYRPSVGAMPDTILRKPLRQNKSMAKEIDRYRRDYCVTDAFLAQLDKVAGIAEENKNQIQERRLTYVLKTGANWAGPIKDFQLTLDGGAGRLVSFCSGNLQPAASGAQIYTAKNFTPERDLNILVVGKF